MSSKQLKSILNQIPSATVNGEKQTITESKEYSAYSNLNKTPIQTERIVAAIPKLLKEEIRSYIKIHKGETEKTVILRALKSIGFNVPNEWIIDKRTDR